jgi:hypothetical protein
LDSLTVLASLERNLRLEIVPAEASGVDERVALNGVRDVPELTRRLLDHPEPTVYAELLARPR